MKKPYILLSAVLLFVLAISSCSRNHNEPGHAQRLAKLHYENASGEKAVTINYYDEAGINQTAKWMLLDSSRISLNYHNFDKAGRMIRKYREYMDGLITTEYYTYNEAGIMTEERIEGSDGRNGSAQHLTDENGRVIVSECDKYKGWFSGTIRYSYNDAGQKSKAVIYRGENIFGQIHYQYNNDGLLLTERWDFEEGWWQEFGYEYENVPSLHPPLTYESPYLKGNNAFRVAEETFDYDDVQKGSGIYSYDEAGILREKRFGSAGTSLTVTTYNFDDNNMLRTSSVAYFGFNSKPTEYVYEFDGNRRLIRRAFSRQDKQGSERYSYDEKGRLKEAIFDNMNGRLSGTMLYHYNQDNHLVSGDFTGDSGYTANVTFTQNNAGLIEKVQWVFSFGKYQINTYRWEAAPAV